MTWPTYGEYVDSSAWVVGHKYDTCKYKSLQSESKINTFKIASFQIKRLNSCQVIPQFTNIKKRTTAARTPQFIYFLHTVCWVISLVNYKQIGQEAALKYS